MYLKSKTFSKATKYLHAGKPAFTEKTFPADTQVVYIHLLCRAPADTSVII